MFDIGFAELLIIGVVALLVVGPEKLPGTIRTASLYLNRLRRGFNEIKREVQQELHNDSIMQDLRKTSEELKNETKAFGNHIQENFSETEAIIGCAFEVLNELGHGFLEKRKRPRRWGKQPISSPNRAEAR